MTDPIVCVGIDPGDDTVLAVVSLRPGAQPLLLDLHEVYGDGERWFKRLDEGVMAVRRDHRDTDRVWLEVPESRIRRSAKMAHHAAGIGLGRRIGAIEAAWRESFGLLPVTVTTGTWWEPWRPALILHPKSEEGTERIGEASRMVSGAAQALARVTSKDRRVDAAEAILIAGAGALDLRREHAEADLRRRALASGARLPADYMAQVKAADKTRGKSRKRRA